MRTNTQLGIATAALLLLPGASALYAAESDGEEIGVEYSVSSQLMLDAFEILGLDKDDLENPGQILFPADVQPACKVPTSPAQGAQGYYIRVLDVGGGFVAQLWQETNHIPGLQPRDHLCPTGQLYLKDTLLGSFDTTRPTSSI